MPCDYLSYSYGSVVNCERIAPSEPGLNSRWYPYDSLAVAGRASGQNYYHLQVKLCPTYLGRHIQALEEGNQ